MTHTTDNKGASDFSDFFRNASPEKKKEVMMEVLREVTDEQRKVVGLPPLDQKEEKCPHGIPRKDCLHNTKVVQEAYIEPSLEKLVEASESSWEQSFDKLELFPRENVKQFISREIAAAEKRGREAEQEKYPIGMTDAQFTEVICKYLEKGRAAMREEIFAWLASRPRTGTLTTEFNIKFPLTNKQKDHI